MKKTLITLAAFILSATTLFAKKVKVTIEGTTMGQEELYLIINEDTANAKLIPIEDSHFSITVKVDKNDIIRIHDYKQWPERSSYVLIPDSKHITINRRAGTIEGSPMSQRLREAIKQVNSTGPEGFHIDVFSEDPKAWEEARERERAMRMMMEEEQRKQILQVIDENQDNLIGAWICYCFSDRLLGGMDEAIHGKHPNWLSHPIIKKKISEKK